MSYIDSISLVYEDDTVLYIFMFRWDGEGKTGKMGEGVSGMFMN